MPALAVDRKRRAGSEDYLFLDFARDAACRSDAPDARAAPPTPSARAPPPRAGDTLRGLERRVARLKRAARRLRGRVRALRRLGVVRLVGPGDRVRRSRRRLRLPVRRRGRGARRTGPALAIDRSDWDDPDYMFLAFVGGDRPGRDCQDEPGEADRLTARRRCSPLPVACAARARGRAGARRATRRRVADRVEELQQELDSLTEDVEDLQEPVDEFELFDECMYLIGVSEYGDRRRRVRLRLRRAARVSGPRWRSTSAASAARTTSSSPSRPRSRRASSATRTPAQEDIDD